MSAGGASLTLMDEVLLLTLDDEKGSEGIEGTLRYGLAGAALMELVAAGCLSEEDGKLVPDAEGDPGDPVLADVLAKVRDSRKPRKAKAWVERLPNLKDRVAEGLVERGVLEEDRGRLLGVIPRTRYPQADPEPERELRARLQAVLLEGSEASERDAMLVALLGPLDLVKRVVPKERRKDAERRAKEIGDSDALGSAVRDAVDGVNAAAATTGGAAAATAG